MSEPIGPPTPRRGLRGRGRRVLPRRRRDPGQPDRHHPDDRRPARPGDVRARPRDDRRRGAARRQRASRSASTTADKVVEAWNPYRTMFDVVWSGRRHVMMGATQIDQYGNQNFAFIGDSAQPEGAAARHAAARPGNTINDTHELLDPEPLDRGVRASRSTSCRGVGYDRAAELGDWVRALPRAPPRRHQPRRARLRDARPPHAPALGAPRRHRRRGRRGDRLRARRSPDDVPETRAPDRRRAALIREVIDPHGLREQEVPNRDARRAAHARSATCSASSTRSCRPGMGWVAGRRASSSATARGRRLGILASATMTSDQLRERDRAR